MRTGPKYNVKEPITIAKELLGALDPANETTPVLGPIRQLNRVLFGTPPWADKNLTPAQRMTAAINAYAMTFVGDIATVPHVTINVNNPSVSGQTQYKSMESKGLPLLNEMDKAANDPVAKQKILANMTHEVLNNPTSPYAPFVKIFNDIARQYKPK